LKETEIGYIYSSPLSRALDTAQAIAAQRKLQVQIKPDLRELEVGELEGITVEELGTEFSQHLTNWREGDGYRKLPGGESLADLKNRVWPAVTDIINTNNHETALIVSHYFVILTIICAALDLPLKTVRRFRIKPGSMSILNFDSIPCLTLLSDTCHYDED
jgi:probable phosphoglycerate mutase